MQQENTTPQWQSQMVSEFPAKWQLQGGGDLLGKSRGAGWTLRAASL